MKIYKKEKFWTVKIQTIICIVLSYFVVPIILMTLFCYDIRPEQVNAQPVKSELVVTSQIRVVSPNGKNQIVIRAGDYSSYLSINEKDNRNVIIFGSRDNGVLFLRNEDSMSSMSGDDLQTIVDEVFRRKNPNK